jgi:hypothetical protein
VLCNAGLAFSSSANELAEDVRERAGVDTDETEEEEERTAGEEIVAMLATDGLAMGASRIS